MPTTDPDPDPECPSSDDGTTTEAAATDDEPTAEAGEPSDEEKPRRHPRFEYVTNTNDPLAGIDD